MNIPEGYKLVPIYPTDDMVSAVIDLGRIDPDDVDRIWSGMIENSPFICESNSRAYDEAKERELFESRWGFTNEEQEIYFIPELNCYGSARVNDAANNKSSALYWWKACAKSRARSAE